MRYLINSIVALTLITAFYNDAMRPCPSECLASNRIVGNSPAMMSPKSIEALKFLNEHISLASRLDDKKLTIYVINIRNKKVIYSGAFYKEDNGLYRNVQKPKDIKLSDIDKFLKKQSDENIAIMVNYLLPQLDFEVHQEIKGK